ncbi:MAG TPA: transglycosylase domain-containing protein [Anaerolineae bacterium]|nr:MAG: Penicillin-binding protein 2D [Chloroflexi bacterium ADurb.Bin222]HOC21617.1 transglycosylase domain-containing protein [Anaerolineae bacterium]HQM14521.1 transglycosylase domain-containing protein [Anaerolineae bacterium]
MMPENHTLTPKPLVRSIVIAGRERRRARSKTGFNLVLRIIGVVILVSLLATTLSVGLVVGAAASAYSAITAGLPTPDEVAAASVQTFETTKIYDRTGQNLLYEVIDPNAGDRNWIRYAEIPEYVTCGTVAMEDRRFWTNAGFDPRGLARAFVNNLQGLPVQGASSITQQVVKNTVIPLEERYVQSYSRKIKEILIAIELTRLYPKEEILEWYLNTNHYGHLAYGIDAAARVYFDKPASALTLSEAATLIAIPQSPLINPFDAPEESLERRDVVLEVMVGQGCITSAEAAAARAETWQLAQQNERFEIKAPHFSMYVRRQLEEMFGAERVAGGGLRVYTTLDLQLNEQATCTSQAFLRILSGEDAAVVVPEAVNAGCEAAQYLPDMPAAYAGMDSHVNNTAMIMMRPTTGEILAMVGSADYWNQEIDGKYNVAVDGLRQPGSSFKPFTYVTLLSQGYNVAHMFLDVRKAFDQGEGRPPYVPENYTRKYSGAVTLRDALARSLNIPAVEAMSIAGIDNVLRTAHRMGINTLDKGLQYYGLSLTLGGGEVHLIDMVYAFSVFDNNGVMYGEPVPAEKQRPGFRELDPVAILRVEDRNGNVLYSYNQPEAQQILEPRLAYLITDILADRRARIPAFGTPNPLELDNDRPAAAKTGTTNDFTDNWVIGYTPQLVTGVWMGNTDASQKMTDLPGARGASFTWHAMMEYALKDEPIVAFTRPEGLVEVTVCAKSGMLPHPHCPTRTELMIPGTEPKEVDTLYQVFRVNRETGRLAVDGFTPPELIEERVYEVYPSEAMDWIASLPEDQRPPIPPTEYDTLYGLVLSNPEVSIISPTTYSFVRGVIPIVGNARGGDFAFYRLVYGPGMSPTEWTQIGPDHPQQVENNVLEFFDMTGLADGLYTLQLQVVGGQQGVRLSTIQLTVDNTPPKADLTYPLDGAEYEYRVGDWVNINVEVNDNYAIKRVEFYKVEDLPPDQQPQPFAVRTAAPFNVNWMFHGAGEHKFYVKVIDAAGNETVTKTVSIRIVPRATP